ncbi:Cof-type HAD-IIB family hydrolase [Streptococcus anginosus]|uniref:Cof-type HAD-IIB family hydrolase n=1 Tax=Streptococcus anginosus TaxID=1328 RepID=UPI0022E91176|nr:Cof-type HAD-IIB family hydrolase [Streptococcus anginosus]
MSEFKILATDLDGTLLNSQLQLSEVNKSVLRDLKEKGVHVVLCTGRPFNGMAHLIDEIGLDAEDYTISYNGSLVQTCDGKTILHRANLSPTDFYHLSLFFAQYGLGVHAMTMDKMYTYNRSIHPLTVRESYLGNLPLTVLEDGQYVREPIIKMMAVGNPEKLDEAMVFIPELFGNLFSLNKSEAFYLEIMQKGDNKATALKLLLKELNLSSNNLIAFGNNQNDLEMIKLAKVGVAVGNAVPELKEKSDFITDTNDNDGVAYFLEHYCA